MGDTNFSQLLASMKTAGQSTKPAYAVSSTSHGPTGMQNFASTPRLKGPSAVRQQISLPQSNAPNGPQSPRSRPSDEFVPRDVGFKLFAEIKGKLDELGTIKERLDELGARQDTIDQNHAELFKSSMRSHHQSEQQEAQQGEPHQHMELGSHIDPSLLVGGVWQQGYVEE